MVAIYKNKNLAQVETARGILRGLGFIPYISGTVHIGYELSVARGVAKKAQRILQEEGYSQ